jgi:RNA polymerase sigma factor (sigma-70 family)
VRVSRSAGSGTAGGPSPAVASDSPGPPAARATHLHLVQQDAYPDWDAVYTGNVARIYRLMYARVANRPDAEDLTAQVFMTALPSLRITASRPEVRAYLTATARTVLAAHWRRTFGLEITTVDLSDLEATVPEPDAPAGPQSAEGRRRLDAILAQLPGRYRAVLELRFLRAYSMREVARELDVSVSNAGVLQHRALRLAADIAERDAGSSSGLGGKDI